MESHDRPTCTRVGGALGVSLLDSREPLILLPCRLTGTPCRTNGGGKEQKTLLKIIERVQAHYKSREMPFGKTYEWHPAYAVLECGCGQKWSIDAKSTITTCQCGCDLANILVRAIQDGEATRPEECRRPWFHDAKERTQQHQRDEEAFPEGSPWRYDDIKAATNEE